MFAHLHAAQHQRLLHSELPGIPSTYGAAASLGEGVGKRCLPQHIGCRRQRRRGHEAAPCILCLLHSQLRPSQAHQAVQVVSARCCSWCSHHAVGMAACRGGRVPAAFGRSRSCLQLRNEGSSLHCLAAAARLLLL